MTKKSNAKSWKILCLILALVLVAATVLGVMQFCTPAGKKIRPSEWFSKKEAPKPQEETGGLEILPDEGNGIALTSAEITREAYAANGISEEAKSAYTITASVYPGNATLPGNGKLNWSLAWYGGIGTWSGSVADKACADYVTLTVAEDSMSATVEMIREFGSQMQICVKTDKDEAGNAIGATCRVECRQRLAGISSKNTELIPESGDLTALESATLLTDCVTQMESALVHVEKSAATKGLIGVRYSVELDETVFGQMKSAVEWQSEIGQNLAAKAGNLLLNESHTQKSQVTVLDDFLGLSLTQTATGSGEYENLKQDRALVLSWLKANATAGLLKLRIEVYRIETPGIVETSCEVKLVFDAARIAVPVLSLVPSASEIEF